MTKWLGRFLVIWEWLFISAVLIFVIMKILVTAAALPYFVDEVVNTQAAYNFLRHGNYTSSIVQGISPAGISSGIATTWISGIVFHLKQNLFVSRFVIGWWHLLQILLISIIVARRYKKSLRSGLLLGTAAILLVFYGIPYWYGFLYNLGELQGCLFLVWALICLPRRKYLASFFTGCAIWGCKFIYAPFLLPLIVLPFCYDEKKSQTPIRDIFLLGGTFFIPFACWLAMIGFQYGTHEALGWMGRFMDEIRGAKSGLSSSAPLNWLERVQSDQLSWKNFPLQEKLAIIFYFFMPFHIWGWIICFKHDKNISKIFRSIIWGTLIALGALSGWYFFKSPNMWLRHAQPAMYVGALFIFCLSTHLWIRWEEGLRKQWVRQLIILFMFFYFYSNSQDYFYSDFDQSHYAYRCQHLFSPECNE